MLPVRTGSYPRHASSIPSRVRVRMRVRVRVHVCVHACVCVCVCMRRRVWTPVGTCVCRVDKCACEYVYVHAYVRECLRVCVPMV